MSSPKNTDVLDKKEKLTTLKVDEVDLNNVVFGKPQIKDNEVTFIPITYLFSDEHIGPLIIECPLIKIKNIPKQQDDEDDDEDDEDDEEPILQEEEKERECDINKKSHHYTGKAYKCEDCHQYGCKDCMQRDYWEERVKDGIFLCNTCFRSEQLRLDIG
jgi:hypothetical protein